MASPLKVKRLCAGSYEVICPDGSLRFLEYCQETKTWNVFVLQQDPWGDQGVMEKVWASSWGQKWFALEKIQGSFEGGK